MVAWHERQVSGHLEYLPRQAGLVLTSRDLPEPEGDDLDVRIAEATVALFARRLRDGAMQLMGSRPFDNGMVELRYELRH